MKKKKRKNYRILKYKDQNKKSILYNNSATASKGSSKYVVKDSRKCC